MGKYRAIPEGYMTVGEVAKKMGVTVRTLQYYDKEGLLSPSSESEGGFRLYTDIDMVKLHQILSLKYLGFSLDDIKNNLLSLDTPADVSDALTEHASTIRMRIQELTESLKAIEALKAEVDLMHAVDWRKYADIIVNLQIKNDMYNFIKHFNDDMLDHIRCYDKDSRMAMLAMKDRINGLHDEAIRLQNEGVLPESEQGQLFVKEYWDAINEFTGGDISLLFSMVEFAETMKGEEGAIGEWIRKQKMASTFIQQATMIYFGRLGYNPFEGTDSGMAMIVLAENINGLYDEVIRLQNEGVSPGSEQGQLFIKEYWATINEFTSSNMSLLSAAAECAENMNAEGGEEGEEGEEGEGGGWIQKQKMASTFIQQATMIYYERLGYNSFAGAKQ